MLYDSALTHETTQSSKSGGRDHETSRLLLESGSCARPAQSPSFRQRAGIRREHAELLRRALLEAALSTDVTLGERDAYGQRYVLDFSMSGQAGSAMVRSTWIVWSVRIRTPDKLLRALGATILDINTLNVVALLEDVPSRASSAARLALWSRSSPPASLRSSSATIVAAHMPRWLLRRQTPGPSSRSHRSRLIAVILLDRGLASPPNTRAILSANFVGTFTAGSPGAECGEGGASGLWPRRRLSSAMHHNYSSGDRGDTFRFPCMER